MTDFSHNPDYHQEHCWQYDIRLRNRADDLTAAGLTEEEVSTLTTDDFEFAPVTTAVGRREATEFIKRHEWLGNLGKFPTHYFTARLRSSGVLAGVVVFGMPNAGNTANERLIQRGACVSWSPVNLASKMLAWCMHYMVEHTEYRIFSCYSDPDARELGTIYQALNFFYVGHTSDNPKFEHPTKPGKWITSRFFRNHRMYRVYAEQLGIEWDEGECGDSACEIHGWDYQRKSGGGGMIWGNVPDEIEAKLRQAGRDAQAAAPMKKTIRKHRYVYVLGRDKRETRKLRADFLTHTKTYPYPKVRGQ
jgi:hypothetical protein